MHAGLHKVRAMLTMKALLVCEEGVKDLGLGYSRSSQQQFTDEHSFKFNIFIAKKLIKTIN